jgi:general secretion pathway protein E
VLRQDPDIIMIGEIRDRQTAEIAVQAALTGHLVLTTLHTNDTLGAVARLVEMGVEPYLLSSALIGVVAQRLVRTLCPHCKVPKALSAAQWAVLADANEALPQAPTPYAPAGCLDCRRTGYLGRVGLYELLPLGSRLRGLIRADMDLAGFSRAARAEGLRTLRRAGLEKVAAGLTTIEEVLTVLPPADEPLTLPDS